MKRNSTNNIIRADFKELSKLGYVPVLVTKDRKGLVNPPPAGSMLCLVNKSQDLWAELRESDIKHSKVTGDKFIILYKPA